MNELLATLQEEFVEKLKKSKILRVARFSQNIKNKIKTAIGMRRTGKTYFLLQIAEHLLQDDELSKIFYLNLEDDRLLPLDSKGLAKLVDDFYQKYPENHDRLCYLFFDEIQNVSDWPIIIRRLLDTKKVDIYLTGSSAKLLSKEIATSLRGRSLTLEIWPYSFNEYLTAKHFSISNKEFSQNAADKLKKQLQFYLQEGGFPEVVGLDKIDRNRILQDYLELVIFRDIVERHEITHITLIKYILNFLINNPGGLLSVNKLFNDIKSQGIAVGKTTLYEYLSYIEDAFLAFSVPLFADTVRKTQSNPKKIYLIDSGLVNACSNKTSPNWGHLFENLIYLDFRRQEKKIYYYLTVDRYEVDFLTIDLEGNRELIQVVWEHNDEETMRREQRALEKAQEELKISGRIITPEKYLADIFNHMKGQ